MDNTYFEYLEAFYDKISSLLEDLARAFVKHMENVPLVTDTSQDNKD